MIVYPAIDLRNGVCVRLMHGRFDPVTEYDQVPAARLARNPDELHLATAAQRTLGRRLARAMTRLIRRGC